MGASWAQVYSFGCNDEGALGRDTSMEGSEMVPGKVELQEKVVQVSAGDSHTAALTEDGRVFLWGSFRVRLGEDCMGGWQAEITGGAPRITHLHTSIVLTHWEIKAQRQSLGPDLGLWLHSGLDNHWVFPCI